MKVTLTLQFFFTASGTSGSVAWGAHEICAEGEISERLPWIRVVFALKEQEQSPTCRDCSSCSWGLFLQEPARDPRRSIQGVTYKYLIYNNIDWHPSHIDVALNLLYCLSWQ